jgi:hypothetical protein
MQAIPGGRHMANPLLAYDPELEMFEGEQEQRRRSEGGVLGDTAEMAVAANVLEITDRADLERFLRNLTRHVGNKIGIHLSSPQADAICDVLAGTIGQALRQSAGKRRAPPAPFGATLGSRLASVPASQLGLELEGLSNEDREFETARRLVRFAAEAVKNALTANTGNPLIAARSGAFAAARRYAPGLVRALERLPIDADAPSPVRLSQRIRHGENLDRPR